MRRAIAFVLLAACGTSAHPEGPAPAPSAASGSAAHDPPPTAAVPAVEVAPPEPDDPAPAVEAIAEVDPYGRVTLSVVNRTGDVTRLSSALVLERDDGGRFGASGELGTFTIGAELADDGCVTLAPGAELRATWSCLRADAPGPVRDCARAGDGRYRFVTTACRGDARTESAAFEYRR